LSQGTCLYAADEPSRRVGARLMQRRFTDVVQDMLTIRMDFSSFADFWAPAEGEDGPVAEYVATLDDEAKTTLRKMVRMAYLDGEQDDIRSYAPPLGR
jgi:hypothetical protein